MSESRTTPKFGEYYSRLYLTSGIFIDGPWCMETPTFGVTPVVMFVHLDTGDLVPLTSVERAVKNLDNEPEEA